MKNLNQILKTFVEESEINGWEVVNLLNTTNVTESEYIDFIIKVEEIDDYTAFTVNELVLENVERLKNVADEYYKNYLETEEFDVDDINEDLYEEFDDEEEEKNMYPEISEMLKELKSLVNVDEYLEEEEDMKELDNKYNELKRMAVTVYDRETELIDTINCNIIEVPLLDLKAIINNRFKIEDIIINPSMESIEEIIIKTKVTLNDEFNSVLRNEITLGQLIEEGMAVCVDYKTNELELSPIEFRGLITEASDVEVQLVVFNATLSEC